jgi:uracil phosphoribosyltransferase
VIFVNEIAMLMTYEVARNLPLQEVEVATPVAKTTGYKVAGDIFVVPILRAGLGLLTGVLKMIPDARVGFIGLYRDEETLKPIEYYCKLPDNKDGVTIVVDPMLATGGSAAAAISMLKARGLKNIRFMCLVAAPEGVKVMNDEHPDVPVYTAALDEKLNEHGYIVPGLGDAGDRIFGTH